MGRLGLALAVVAPLVGRPLVATAEPTAADLVKQAIAKSKAGDHDDAIDLYKEAYDLAPNPVLLSNLGTEYAKAGKPRLALKYFCKYLHAEPTGPNASYARTKVVAIRRELGDPAPDDDNVCPQEQAEPPPEPKPEVAPTSPTPPPTAPAPSAARRPNHALEYTGGALGALGIVGLALGIHYGVDAKDLNDAIDGHPVSEPWPTAIDGVPIGRWSSQGAAWNRDTYGFAIAGSLALVAGIALVVVGHHGSPAAADTAPSISIAPTAGGIAAFGRF